MDRRLTCVRLLGLATLMLVPFAHLSSAQQEPNGVQVRLSGSRTSDRFGPQSAFKFEIAGEGTSRVVTLPASAGASSVSEFFVVGQALFVVGANSAGWCIYQVDIETSRVIKSVGSPSPPVVSPNQRYLAYLHSEPRGVAALKDEALMVLDTSTGARRAVFPESRACTSEDYLPEADRNFLTSIGRPLLWSVDSRLLVFVSRPRLNYTALQLAAVDMSSGSKAMPTIARRLLDLSTAQEGAEPARDWSLISADSLEWAPNGRVHIGFQDRGGAPGFFLDVAAPSHGAAPCPAKGPRFLLRDNEIPGVTTRLATAFRWFQGTDADGSLLFADGTQQLLIGRQAESVATARYARFEDVAEATKAAQFLPALLGLHLHPWSAGRDGTCPGTFCWVAADESAYRLLVQRGAFLVWVNGYSFLFWDNGEPESSPADRAKLVIDVSQTILSNAGGGGGRKTR